MPTTKLYVVTGASGAGKTKITEYVIAEYPGQVEKVATSTTRKPRENEKYYYPTISEFKMMVRQDKMVEWEEYLGNYYGLTRAELDRIAAGNSAPILVVDVIGALKYMKKIKSDRINLDGITVTGIYITAPKDQLIQRILDDNEKGIRNDSDEVIQKRIDHLEFELAQQVHFEHVIENKNGRFDFALNEFANLVLHYQ